VVMNIKPNCPKCGSSNVSGLMPNPPLRGGLHKTEKQWPEPHNDEPPDKYIKPAMDFNHTHYCNSCGHYFGGGWGGAME